MNTLAITHSLNFTQYPQVPAAILNCVSNESPRYLSTFLLWFYHTSVPLLRQLFAVPQLCSDYFVLCTNGAKATFVLFISIFFDFSYYIFFAIYNRFELLLLLWFTVYLLFVIVCCNTSAICEAYLYFGLIIASRFFFHFVILLTHLSYWKLFLCNL